MVLLTSSAVSVIISSCVVCLFTFLLFLSGYVLQQQTVRSLQEALSAPVEVRFRVQPTPLLPKPVTDFLPGTEEDNETSILVVESGTRVKADGSTAQIVMGANAEGPDVVSGSSDVEPSIRQLWHAHVDSTSTDSPGSVVQNALDSIPFTTEDALDGYFAYVLSLPNPSDICSALLFTKWQRQFSRLRQTQVNIIFLYPSDWETSSHPTHVDALRMLVQSEHKYSVLLHPVQISKVWTGIDVESQLLSELASNRWIYDRFMYLRTPGMLIDTTRLDSTLLSTYLEPSLLKTSWSKLRAPARRSVPTNIHPDILLFAQGRGLMTPQGELGRTLTAKARTSHLNNHDDEVRDEFLAKEAAYVLFDEAELLHRRREKLSYNGIFERFERERKSVCEASRLL